MNTGIISSRYADAFLRFTEENGSSDLVCAQIRKLLADKDMASVQLEPDLEKFVALLVRKGRMEDVRLIFRTYVEMYYRKRGIVLAHLTTTIPSPELEKTLQGLLEKQFGCEVQIETEVNPALIGGFVLLVGDHLLDASVKQQIESLRRQFVISNNRIV